MEFWHGLLWELLQSFLVSVYFLATPKRRMSYDGDFIFNGQYRCFAMLGVWTLKRCFMNGKLVIYSVCMKGKRDRQHGDKNEE